MNRKITSGGATVLNILSNAGMLLGSLIYLYRTHNINGLNQLGKGRFPPCNSLAYARPPMDDRDEQQESQHGAFPGDCMGLAMINEGHVFVFRYRPLKL